MKYKFMPKYSFGEELMNCITHGIGAALGVSALSILVVYSSYFGDAWRVVSFSVYGATLILLYLASTLYHAMPHDKVRQLFRYFDHISIFLLIAGTYTPIALVPLRGPWGWTLFGIIWGLAVTGIVVEAFSFKAKKIVGLILYVSMGWIIIIAYKPIKEILPEGFFFWLILGGLCYMVGIIFYVVKKIPFNHAIWHLFVLAGSILHFLGMIFYIA